MVVPRFVERALKGEPIQIHGTGKQSRCFCYVGDLVEAIVGLVRCDEAPGKVFNIGSTEEIGIEALADKVVEMTHSKSGKEYVPYETAYGRPIEDMMRRVPNVERIKQTTGWEAQTSLCDTLQEIIDSFRR
jgi:UDP-glucose 4-epimerase